MLGNNKPSSKFGVRDTCTRSRWSDPEKAEKLKQSLPPGTSTWCSYQVMYLMIFATCALFRSGSYRGREGSEEAMRVGSS
jgi:hypothetical protein